jgi:hypothetical protein
MQKINELYIESAYKFLVYMQKKEGCGSFSNLALGRAVGHWCVEK